LGGGARAQALSAGAAATSPLFLAGFHLLSTAAFDMFFWAAISFVVLRFLRTGDDRLLVVLGGLAGLALMNKLNVAFFLVALTIGLLLGGRPDVLRNQRFWTGAQVALVIWAPNIIWNAQHHWASISMMHQLHAENSGLGASLGFLPSQLFVVGPLLAVLWVAGLVWLLRSRLGRPFGIAYIALAAWYVVTGGKSYYLAGMYFVLLAAGSVWAEARLRSARRVAAVMLIGLIAALPLALPVLPESALARSSWEGNVNKDLSATVGWPTFVGQVAQVAATLPPDQRAHLVVFTGDYGAAGAVDLYGPRYGLPHAVSGHNNYWWWGPPKASIGTTTIAVNLPRRYLLTIFSQVTPAGTVATPGNVWTEERGDPIWICRQQKLSWQAAWPAARHYG
ncbi:MAG: glycosyltransferase family 39 protein, partial [Acidimicrobiaceae bacterium]|nr:glycosyltransferase family 39 protein [Acidimicrobiaceae bacterium]